MYTPYPNDYPTEDTDATASPPLRSEFRPPPREVHDHAAHGFAQMFGLHPIPAITTLAVNAMLFGGQIATVGALTPLVFLTAIVLAYITYKSQMRFYGDDAEAARIKALAVGLLTAIPIGLPAFLTLPSTVVGVVHTLRKGA
jgi:hypothetical protein